MKQKNHKNTLLQESDNMKKRPWNRIDAAVYSISSQEDAETFNMNIATYITAVSMQPKIFLCAIYEGTRTLSNVRTNPVFILQLLSDDQYKLVTLLGKQSGNKIDKISRLEKRNELTRWKNFPVLKNAIAWIELKAVDVFQTGDHHCFVCEMKGYKNVNPGIALSLETLRKNKIISV